MKKKKKFCCKKMAERTIDFRECPLMEGVNQVALPVWSFVALTQEFYHLFEVRCF